MLNSIVGILAVPSAGGNLPVSGAALWLDANDASTFTYSSSTYVSQWNDKSGNAYNFTQASSGSQPFRLDNTQNGKPALVMNYTGTGRWIANSSYDFSASAFTVFAVYDTNGGNYSAVLGRNSGNPSPALALGTDANSVNYAISKIQNATSSSNLSVTGSNADVVAYKSAGISSGSVSVMIYKNGTAASGAVSLTGLNAGNKAIIGASLDGGADGFVADGYVCEIIVYPSQLSDGDRNLVEAYLKTKWGTP